jgi:hypothetical protein
LSRPAKKDGGWGGFSFTLNNMTRIGPESQVNTNPEPSDWARGISKMEQYEWLSQTAISQMRCDDDYTWGGGDLHGPNNPNSHAAVYCKGLDHLL